MTGLDATIARALDGFPAGTELSFDSLRDAATAAQLGPKQLHGQIQHAIHAGYIEPLRARAWRGGGVVSDTPALAGCDQYGLVSVHHSARGIVRRKAQECWTCKRRTPFVIQWDGAYYGTTEWCIACLDGWQDGYRLERPFRPRWKPERAAAIKDKWDTAMLPARYRAWVNFDVHRATCWTEEPGESCATREARPT